jgi:hypothetical protein
VRVFDLAWQLYRRGFGFLVLAGLFASVVEAVIVYAAIMVGFARISGIGPAGSSPATALSAGIGTVMIGLLVSQLITLVLRGGMMKMVLDSARSGARMDFTTLFAGFSRFLSYLGLWGITGIAVPLGMFVLIFGVTAVIGPFALLLWPAVGIFAIWLAVCWVYGLPLIADRGLNPIAALEHSRAMVRRNGWWTTFLPLLLLSIVAWVVTAVVSVAGIHSDTSRYLNIGVVEILIMPFMICFIASMYLGGERPATVSPQGPWPSFPAGSGSYGPPFSAPATYGPPTAPSAPAPPDPAREADAWAAASDPLAGMPPRDPA